MSAKERLYIHILGQHINCILKCSSSDVQTSFAYCCILRAVIICPLVVLNLEDNVLKSITFGAISYNAVSNSVYVAPKNRMTHELRIV